ncbi:hypothetical protein LVD15_04230 [Fulvivirga maritima]|uniref:hypothetical protein n=1 Tax=Fulvivirga maritima TaxID=2904247 RepID=UPI001F18A240|nr:hypothetical protein [Fulvivirga maritima]UII27640.1 hypothetical protein LVD15_04230 [Fulvivirga maritima]
MITSFSYKFGFVVYFFAFMKKLFSKDCSKPYINLAFLIFFHFLLSLCAFTQVRAQESYEEGQYRVKLEVIEVCGFGDPDGDSLLEYRWKIWAKLKEEDDNLYRGGVSIGVNDFPQGNCITEAENSIGNRIGPLLPYNIFNKDDSYLKNGGLDFNIRFEGFEKGLSG